MLVALGAYLAIVGLAFTYERQQLSAVVANFRKVHKQEETLSKISNLLARMMTNPDLGTRPQLSREFVVNLREHISAVQQVASLLNDVYPALLGDLRNIALDFEHDVAPSFAREELQQARTRMYGVVLRLEDAGRDVRARRMAASEEYGRINDRMSRIVIGATVLGVIVFGSIITLFLGKLAADVEQVEHRALDVALGYRGPPLDVTRHDEVGGMMSAVNRMQLELRQHEKQLELSRQQRFHQEKMAAVGSLAAAVAHEINNPIEAIFGMAQRMTQSQKTGRCPGLCEPQLILEQAQRIASITRDIAHLTAPRSPQPQLLDVNAIVRNTSNFISYDKRFSSVTLTLDLASDLRAVKAVPDHLMQILMNLLINAADAVVGIEGRNPAIQVSTRASNGEVVVIVQDNGHGMMPEVLSKAFEEYFTTKPAESGSGLGLFLCKALIEQNGGRIDIRSKAESGTIVSLHLPLPAPRAPAA